MRKVWKMRLDEVIAEIEEFCICPSSDEYCVLNDVYKDALHYLRQYQEVATTLHKHGFGSVWGITLPNPEKVEGKPDIDGSVNQPLTWEELSEMKGKPIWMEFKNGDKFWIVIYNVGRLQDGTCVLTDKTEFYTDRGKDWNAYRRERHEDLE